MYIELFISQSLYVLLCIWVHAAPHVADFGFCLVAKQLASSLFESVSHFVFIASPALRAAVCWACVGIPQKAEGRYAALLPANT